RAASRQPSQAIVSRLSMIASQCDVRSSVRSQVPELDQSGAVAPGNEPATTGWLGTGSDVAEERALLAIPGQHDARSRQLAQSLEYRFVQRAGRAAGTAGGPTGAHGATRPGE